jgi:Spy/CpxP family protein refolding chaperone
MRIRTAAVGLMAFVAIAAAFAAQTTAAARQDDAKAAAAIADARKVIGGRKLEALKSFSVEAGTQRNVGTFQMNADLELLVEMPDKYMRAETPQGGMMNVGMTTGFNGDRPLKAAAPGIGPGGGMIIRMGPGGPAPASTEKPTPEQQQQIDRTVVRSSRQELSRLMLGWFGATHPSLNARFTYAGEAESPDGKADVIDVKNADGFAARLFIDKETHLPLMLTYQGPQARVVTMGGPRAGGPGGGERRPVGAPGQPPAARQVTDEERKKMTDDAQRQMEEMRKQPPAMVDYTLYFDDWREVDGIKFPHRLRRAAAGATTEEWSVGKVRINPKIDPRKFEAAGVEPGTATTRDERVR